MMSHAFFGGLEADVDLLAKRRFLHQLYYPADGRCAAERGVRAEPIPVVLPLGKPISDVRFPRIYRAPELLERDCQDFRVWAGIMGKKESHYVPTQRTRDPV